MTSSITTTVCGAVLLLAPLSSAQREFTFSDGKKLQAEINTASETEVTLKMAKDGKDVTIPLARLSEEDQQFVAAWLVKRKLNTRPERKLTLSLQGGQTSTVEIPKGDYLSEDGTLTLYPGDTVHLEFDEGIEGASKPRIVSEVKDPERTITFSMSQEDGITTLERKTQMHKTVAMDCTYRELGAERFSLENLRPTERGHSFTKWPGTIWTLRLSNFEVSNRPASEVYRERVPK